MSLVSVTLLATFSVVCSRRIESVQQAAAADVLYNRRNKDENLQHSAATVERRTFSGKGFFNCGDEEALIEKNNKDIRKYQKASLSARSFRVNAEKEGDLLTPHRPEDEGFLRADHLQKLSSDLNAGIEKLQTRLAREKQAHIDLLCHAKRDVIDSQGQVIAIYVEIIEFNMKVVETLQRMVVAHQASLIDECQAMLSDILATEEEFGIHLQQSRGEQAQVEMELHEALAKDIETLNGAKKDFDSHARGGSRVIGYQKKVIDKYKNALIVSFVRLKDSLQSNAKIKKMQVALENILTADMNKMQPQKP